MPRADVKAAQIAGMAGRASAEVLDAGRQVVMRSSKLWRRVTDGNPCGWCAMLAARGPVYRSAAAAGEGHLFHRYTPQHGGGNCGCTVEPFEGDPSEWEPTPGEQRFIDAYDSVHQPGMSSAETAARMQQWLADPANAAQSVAKYSIDGLTSAEADDLLMKLTEAGDWEGAERVGELIDAQVAAATPKPWAPDVLDAYNPQTYEWFEGLSENDQYAFIDRLPNGQSFMENQWAFINAKSAPKRAAIPTERQIRAEWDAYIESEWVRIEEATNGVTLTRDAVRAGRRTRDLLRANPKTARKWASEEVRRYWDENGRMTYESFKAGYSGGVESLGKTSSEFWA